VPATAAESVRVHENETAVGIEHFDAVFARLNQAFYEALAVFRRPLLDASSLGAPQALEYERRKPEHRHHDNDVDRKDRIVLAKAARMLQVHDRDADRDSGCDAGSKSERCPEQ
jgi:hypothetical protein